MRNLVEGIHRFQRGMFGAQRDLFRRLVEGQEPEALFITCSDSRIVPNLITQTLPGDLFILRNAGNIVPPAGIPSGEAGTIEYAVEALAVSDIIVCGHTHCGAMKAVIDPSETKNLPAGRAGSRTARAPAACSGAPTGTSAVTRWSRPPRRRTCSSRSSTCAPTRA